SSGQRILDDAAIRIVRLAAPFPTIPVNEEKLDELYVTRTWQFLPGDTLQTK
ncbi:MAG: energy transducer TonB, partial [Dokdonella sp.]